MLRREDLPGDIGIAPDVLKNMQLACRIDRIVSSVPPLIPTGKQIEAARFYGDNLDDKALREIASAEINDFRTYVFEDVNNLGIRLYLTVLNSDSLAQESFLVPPPNFRFPTFVFELDQPNCNARVETPFGMKSKISIGPDQKLYEFSTLYYIDTIGHAAKVDEVECLTDRGITIDTLTEDGRDIGSTSRIEEVPISERGWEALGDTDRKLLHLIAGLIEREDLAPVQ